MKSAILSCQCQLRADESDVFLRWGGFAAVDEELEISFHSEDAKGAELLAAQSRQGAKLKDLGVRAGGAQVKALQ